MKTLAPMAIIVSLAIAACTQADPPVEDTTASDKTASAAPSAPSTDTDSAPTEAPGRSFAPQAISNELQTQARLSGELGCGFSSTSGEALLLSAADVDPQAGPANAVITFDGTTLTRLSGQSGGFAALSEGMRFEGPDGLVVNVVKSGAQIREAPQVAEESPRYNGQIVLNRDGQELGIDGFWECGP